MKENDRIVYRTEDGRWANKRVSDDFPSTLHHTQEEAQDAAREMLKQSGGGELITKGIDGKIRDKDTVAPGNDPRGVRG